MNITEIQVSLTPNEVRQKDKILAFVRIVLEHKLAIRDIKIMEREGAIQLAMPSRKIVEPCQACKRKVAITDQYCATCGIKQPERDILKRGYVDTTHPINPDYRAYLEEKIAAAYNAQVPDQEKLRLRTIQSGE